MIEGVACVCMLARWVAADWLRSNCVPTWRCFADSMKVSPAIRSIRHHLLMAGPFASYKSKQLTLYWQHLSKVHPTKR